MTDTTGTSSTPTSAALTADGWSRLDRRSLLVHAKHLPPAIGALLVTRFVSDTAVFIVAGSAVVLLGLAAVFGLVAYATTWYRLTPERVEFRSGWLFKKEKSTPRDRIRSVDLTAKVMHQLLGLNVVRIGTGQQKGSEELELNALSRADADALRAVLLKRAEAPRGEEESTEQPRAGQPEADDTAPGEVALARMNWSWIRYAPLTAWTLLIAAAPVGLFFRGLDMLNIKPNEVGLVRSAWDWFTGAPALAVGIVVPAVLLIGVLGALAIYVEMWWAYRLDREPGGTLRVRRGLLTTRSISLEERRLRGVQIVESLPMRWADGAEPRAIVTGTANDDEGKEKESNRDALGPPGPIAEARRLATIVLGDADALSGRGIRPHPVAALRRRLLWATWGALSVAAIGAVLGALLRINAWWTGLAGLLVVLVAGLPMAYVAYRNLGNRLTDAFLIVRSGAYTRRTVALQRGGIIGWRFEQSPFQRRAGIMTVVATTAAGSGAYRIRDIESTDGVELASEAAPELLRPFLEDNPHPGPLTFRRGEVAEGSPLGS